MIKVLVVEDSPVAREFLTYILTSDPAIQVVGTANNGVEALKSLEKNRPDVITMDIHMPLMDGFEATRRIMETIPTPIVIVSGSTGVNEVSGTFRAIEAGALAVVRRPHGINHEEFETGSRELIQTVKLMSEVRVVKLIHRISKTLEAILPVQPSQRTTGIQAIAIGASTGGPLALKDILSGLPRGFPVPVLIVQHIAKGFVDGFTEWLSGASQFPLSVASHGERLAPGHGYIAPDDFHMEVDFGLKIVLSDFAPENSVRPSVSFLFRSMAQVFGPAATGVLLTGMGRDGAEELKTMKDKGAITIAQDEESSVVYGMPGEAIKLGAAIYVLPPKSIAAILTDLVKQVK